ncbi:MAG: XRE family transcriptional regulator [Spirochaetia bacterium]|nr:XRE family transcriptional regulator [Spirochaetia bacterium]MCF7953171.1 XRE family transcriptional regulator [Spirochaetales bacterium]
MKNSEIGIHIKKMRLQQKRSQQELAQSCGYTKSHLSKIERGKVIPSLGALDKIAEALRIKVSILLGEESQEEIVHNPSEQAQKEMMETAKGYSIFPFAVAYHDKKMQPFLFSTERAKHIPHTTCHESEEFMYVIEGEMILKIGKKEYHLKSGDGLYFNARYEHQTIPLTETVKVLDIFV